MNRYLIGSAAVLAMAACSSPEGAGEKAAASHLSASAKAGAVSFSDNSEQGEAKREFSYSWPGEVSAIPALAAELTQERDVRLAEQTSQWTEMAASCPPDAVSCRMNTYESEWTVVADTPGYLSLSNSFYTYTGGAHGNYGRAALVWDREAGRSLEPLQMFGSPDALDSAIGRSACDLLNAEREKRRGQPVPQGAGEWPNQCVAIDEAAIFLGSSTGTRFDQIGVYYAPYVAGAYAEGDFELTLPVTEAVLDAVQPAYRDAFSPAK